MEGEEPNGIKEAIHGVCGLSIFEVLLETGKSRIDGLTLVDLRFLLLLPMPKISMASSGESGALYFLLFLSSSHGSFSSLPWQSSRHASFRRKPLIQKHLY